jgi:hypothetical protein
MLRVIYRHEFHIYLNALYPLRRAKPIWTRLVSDDDVNGLWNAATVQDYSSAPYGVVVQ